MTPLEWGIVVLALVGAFFGGVASVGIVRLPDVYTRTHAASKSDTLGAVLAIGAAALAIQTDLATIKAVFLLVFMFLTNPTAAHAVARAAQDQGIEPWTAGDEEGES
ncbi:MULTISPECIES: monovalent cation/H(+) antiporter subunit G [Haloarcula]|uniref:Monovalent cation/H(+) antiporter subunit G n=2 Tax=Haloarcula TaxID=2237 RepID=A0A482TAW4_HALHI|nr:MULTISPECIES: monovalent cation/H(+) antiporter subunit G [Haloarcula]AJF26327.1 cation:proton antiporter [Haloarcula sp. CBA1115]EMA20914.1 monovalent cation/H+ antiporter subunit G [Haloarcula amylolytica JCM 13557]KZX48044.1 cation:proton antiporter [Haloarcula sp. K1]MCJ0621093.1 monovalent cation/H(+) antiporter subunit G [Haloarcula hispanica]MUV50746.1 Na+/H+ antiporter subunit G [Haloarcula sp. CBA1122]